jgi:hypothetical protein
VSASRQWLCQLGDRDFPASQAAWWQLASRCPRTPGPVVRPAGQQSPVTERKPCQSTPSPAVSAPTARPPITWVGPPACGSLSPPAAGRRRAPEPRPLAGPVCDPAGPAGTAARRSAATATRWRVVVFGLAAASMLTATFAATYPERHRPAQAAGPGSHADLRQHRCGHGRDRAVPDRDGSDRPAAGPGAGYRAVHRPGRLHWASDQGSGTAAGPTWCASTTRSFGACWRPIGGRRTTRPETVFSRRSTGRHEPYGAHKRSFSHCSQSGSRLAQESTPGMRDRRWESSRDSGGRRGARHGPGGRRPDPGHQHREGPRGRLRAA